MFARTSRTPLILMVGLLGSAFALAACGSPGSSGTQAPPTGSAAAGAGCAPVAGDTLVALADDKHLQNADNIIAVGNSKAATAAAIAATDKVADILDQGKLVGLNKAVQIDRKTPQQAAQEFAAKNGLTSGLSGGSGAIVVGAAGFPESQVLAEVYKIALTTAGFQASVLQSTNREVYEAALEKGDIGIFPEYAATITEFLNQKANGKTATPKASGDVNATVAALKPLATQYGLVVGKPATATDQNAFATTKAAADKYGLKTLSDFAAKCSGTASVLAGPAECPQRPFCLIGLQNTYKITFGGPFFQADIGAQVYTALKTGKATLGLALSSDAELASA